MWEHMWASGAPLGKGHALFERGSPPFSSVQFAVRWGYKLMIVEMGETTICRVTEREQQEASQRMNERIHKITVTFLALPSGE